MTQLRVYGVQQYITAIMGQSQRYDPININPLIHL